MKKYLSSLSLETLKMKLNNKELGPLDNFLIFVHEQAIDRHALVLASFVLVPCGWRVINELDAMPTVRESA